MQVDTLKEAGHHFLHVNPAENPLWISGGFPASGTWSETNARTSESRDVLLFSR
jgi:hypothetical protein